MRKSVQTTPLTKSTARHDPNQTIPTLVVRGRDVPLVVLEHAVEWRDLVGRGDEAVCDAGYEVILYRDRADGIICLTRTGQLKLRRSLPGRVCREWMYNYTIFYIHPEARDGARHIDYLAKPPLSLNRIATTLETNVRRYPNNAHDGCGCAFQPDLAHTVEEGDPITFLLFELRWGKRRCEVQ